MDLHQAIKFVRHMRGLKQKDLAGMADISVSYLSLLERKKRNPSISTLQKISEAMGVSLPLLALLGATEDGLEKIDPVLARRVSANAFEAILRE